MAIELTNRIRRPAVILGLKAMVPIAVFFIVNLAWLMFDAEALERGSRIDSLEQVGKVLGAIQSTSQGLNEPAVLEILDSLKKLGTFNIIRISKDGVVLPGSNINNQSTDLDRLWALREEKLQQGRGPASTPIETGDFVYAKVKFSGSDGKYDLLAISAKPPLKEAFFNVLKFQYKQSFIFAIELFLCLLITIIYGQKELFDIFDILRGSKLKAGDFSNIQSDEGKRIIAFAEQGTRQIEDLKAEHEKRSGLVTEGMQRLVGLADQGLTSFEGTLAVYDLKGYSGTRKALQSDAMRFEFDAEFRKWNNGLVERFGARIYEVAGDQYICFFEDQPHISHQRMALHYLSAIHEELPVFCETLAHLGIKTLKARSAIVSSKIRFGYEDKNMSIDHTLLTRLGRLLKFMTDAKLEGTGVFKNEFTGSSSHVQIAGTCELVFKKSDNEENEVFYVLNQVIGFAALAKSSELLDSLPYLRLEKDVLGIFEKIKEASKSNPSIDRSLAQFAGSLRMPQPSARVCQAYLFILNNCTQSDILERLTSFSVNVAAHDKFRNECISSLLGLFASTHDRLVANARDCLMKIAPEQVNLLNFITGKNHRAAVSSVVDKTRTEGLSPFAIETLTDWIHGDSDSFRLSGSYAIYTIAEHFFRTSPKHFAVEPGFEILQQLLFSDECTQMPATQKWRDLYRSKILKKT